MLHYQSGFMAQLFRKFPEIVLTDDIYNVNKAGMPLYSFMIEDGFGNGRVSFYAALAEESAECLELIIHSFKEVNPTSNEIRVIVIDKDFTEYKVLTNEFPQAKILFCQFQVVKCFNKMVPDCNVPKGNRE